MSVRSDKGKPNTLRGIGQKGHRATWARSMSNPDSLPEPLTPKQLRLLLHLGDATPNSIEDNYGVTARCFKQNGVWRQFG